MGCDCRRPRGPGWSGGSYGSGWRARAWPTLRSKAGGSPPSGGPGRGARRSTPAGCCHAGLRRHPHALRRAGDLGLLCAVVLARRDHGGDGQLRRRLRAVHLSARPPHQPDGGRRGHSRCRARRRDHWSWESSPTISTRSSGAQSYRPRRAGSSRRPALLRDGRARRRLRIASRPRKRTSFDDVRALLAEAAVRAGALGFSDVTHAQSPDQRRG